METEVNENNLLLKFDLKEEKFHFTEHPGLKSLDIKKQELKKKFET